jgi:hypothetical protein
MIKMRKYVVSTQEQKQNAKVNFVFVGKTFDECDKFVKRRYHNITEIKPTVDELFKLHIVRKYSYVLNRTYTIQSRFIIKIMAIKLKEES